MPARSRTRKWSIDRRVKQSFIGRMLYNQIFRSRKFLLLLGFTVLLISVNRWFLNPSINISKHSNARFPHRAIDKRKIVEITDRQPTYKLYIYEGYEVAYERYRAEAKLLDNIKLHDKCQQNPKTIVVDVGASLGQFGLYAAACGCQVYMFEVNPLKVSLLKLSIKLNSFESRVTLIEKAVSDLPINSQVYLSLNRSHQISPNEMNDSLDLYSAETINLSQLNFSSDIYLLHVDVGGYEIHVIRSGEKLFHENRIHHVLFQFTPSGTDRVLQNDLLSYMRDILGGKRFYALHPKEAVLYGPLYNEDIDQFYSQHQTQNISRDVYVLFQDDELNINSKSYDFQSSMN